MLPAYQQMFARHLRRLWTETNQQAFHGRLRPPVFAISKGLKTLGSWRRDTRTISISAELLMNRSLLEVEETLKHEMAHQYADEALEAHAFADETPHGSAFRHACRALGIDHSARFQPHGEPPPILRRIQKLLALADSQNVYEAEAAMAKARALMDKYELDLGAERQEYRYAFFGEPRKQKSMRLQLIASLLTRFFHVELVWIPSQLLTREKTVWLMEVNGSQTNLEIAEYVHDYLVREVERLWLDHRRRTPGVKGKTAKRDYQVGVLKGLIRKLGEAETPRPANRAELMTLKREKLRAFFERRHPQLRAGRRMTYRESAEYHAGYKKGQALEIRRGIKEHGSNAALDDVKRIETG